MIRIAVGFDQKEAVAYHVLCQSIIERTTEPVSIIPLAEGMFEDVGTDGTNAFTLSRFLVPYLCDFSGWAIYADSDMLLRDDLANLWAQREKFTFDKGVAVVQHEYKTRFHSKYVGTPMEAPNLDYPRKNWSSLILWNCGHMANRVLTPEFVKEKGGKYLHRFEWLKNEQVGKLDSTWNHLIGETQYTRSSLFHYTLGIPGIPYYADEPGALPWHQTLISALECAGQKPHHLLNRTLRLIARRGY
jgi:lipopolysaccharide biosynthesis glycosyltransferase